MKPRKRINPVSERQKERLKEYAKVKREWWKLVKGAWCPVMWVFFGKKVRVCGSPHHTRGRVGSLLCDTQYWLAVSKEGHEWIHNNMGEAREHGWLCAKGDWNRQ